MLPDSADNINLACAESHLESQLDNLERRLTDSRRQIEQLQRLAALGTGSVMLAHEFNNLLTPIVSYCGYALQRKDPDMMRTAVEKAHASAQRLNSLCRHVMGLATDEQTGPADTLLLPLVREAVECLGRDLEKDQIALFVNVPADLKARVVPGAIRQVLFNLVINARQAMLDKPGRLDISAQRLGVDEIAIEVSDTGCGIKPENLDRIFEPFYTTKRHESRLDRQGIGLGLHICRQIMEEQHGTISVASTPGQGTTFTLRLPAMQG